MRLYDVYKMVYGQKTFVRRVPALSATEVEAGLPTLPAGQKYLRPTEVTDPEWYIKTIEEAKRHAKDPRAYPNPNYWYGVAFGLQKTLEKMK